MVSRSENEKILGLIIDSVFIFSPQKYKCGEALLFKLFSRCTVTINPLTPSKINDSVGAGGIVFQLGVHLQHIHPVQNPTSSPPTLNRKQIPWYLCALPSASSKKEEGRASLARRPNSMCQTNKSVSTVSSQ